MSKQKFNRKTLYTKTCVDNILAVFDKDIEYVDETGNWYQKANDFARGLSVKYDVELIKVCGVIAALSPLKNWDENKRIAESFIKNGNAYHTDLFKEKAKAILQRGSSERVISHILNGNKIVSFFLNIWKPNNNSIVTIDRHAQDIAIGRVIDDAKRKMTINQYNFFVNCYTIAANMRDVSPSTMQAVTWVKHRQYKKNKSNEGLPF